MPTETELRVRFWEKVEVGEEDDCWMWLGNPRGQFRMGRHVVHVRRVAWEFTYGAPPPRTHLKLTCGERLCCNPAHIDYRAESLVRPERAGAFGRTRFTRTEKWQIQNQYRSGESLYDLRSRWNANTAVLLDILKTET